MSYLYPSSSTSKSLAQRSGDASYTGARWPKYHYFNSGVQYPYTGFIDRFNRIPEVYPKTYLTAAKALRPSMALLGEEIH